VVVDSYQGKLAVVTGGGTGIGRELVTQLAAAGCSVATCDVALDAMAETAELAAKEATGATVTTHACDVSDEAQVTAFRDEVVARHGRDHINVLVNNAGIAGGGSFLAGPRDEWERVFGVDWFGVYNCSRAFVPLLVASDEGALVNVSSINGFWASLGPGTTHTAYSTAKFAVKGFSEALIGDFRIHAPHVSVHVVMPGHVGTDIAINSWRAKGREGPGLTEDDVAEVRVTAKRRGRDVDHLDDDQLRAEMAELSVAYREDAPLTAAGAATIILDGVLAGRWRILVGDDAARLDEWVRANPERAYDPPSEPLPFDVTTLGGDEQPTP
jgi:NAD(P)-dependent dehydrogenase (short-subunit alcohol dehydrogenase family)